jgi:hypothetical protein
MTGPVISIVGALIDYNATLARPIATILSQSRHDPGAEIVHLPVCPSSLFQRVRSGHHNRHDPISQTRNQIARARHS